jgi:hypothetical protein
MSALARRAREGLRAAYLQAHLAADDGRSSCAAIRSKLGTYTAGGVQGVEERRIRAHLDTCSSCSQLYTELNEVCATLRANAAFLVVPSTLGLAFAGKVLISKTKMAVAAASVATVGLFGTIAAVLNGGPGVAILQPDQHPVIAMSTSGSSSGHSQEIAVAPSPEAQQQQQQQQPPPQQRENVVNPGGAPKQETVRRTTSNPPPTQARRDPPVERALPVVQSSSAEVITTVVTTSKREIRSLDTPPSSSEPVYPPPPSDPCSSPQTTSTTITLYPKAPVED